jgi:siroheme synthase
MALSTLDAVAVRLISGGRDPATAVAVISRASLGDRAVLRTTLGAATLAMRRAGVASPALVVIGPVVGLAAEVLAASPEIRMARTVR